jgi:hypothetical protein
MKEFRNLITENQFLIAIIMSVFAFAYIVKTLNVPAVIINCSDGSSVVIDVPLSVESEHIADMMKMYTIPIQCGATK